MRAAIPSLNPSQPRNTCTNAAFRSSRILAETCSYDTIGNAFFARTVHTDPRGLRRLLIVNSKFHMPRTEAIFRWVFGAAPDCGYDLVIRIH